MNRLLIALLASAVVFTGCMHSLKPTYTKEQPAPIEYLLGKWKSKNVNGEPLYWELTKRHKTMYDLSIYSEYNKKEDEKRDSYIVIPFKVDEKVFVDISPNVRQALGKGFYRTSFIPVHSMFHVQFKDQKVLLIAPNPAWIKDFLKKHPDALRHEIYDGEILVTDKPEKIQEFFVNQLDDKDAFGGIFGLERFQDEKAETKKKSAPEFPVQLGDSRQQVIDKMKALKAENITDKTKREFYASITGEQEYFWWLLPDKSVVAVLLAGKDKDNLRVVTVEVGETGKGIEGIENWRKQYLKISTSLKK